MDRREILKTACAAAATCGLPARIWGAAQMMGKPDLTFGVLSDTHVHVGPGDDPVKATQLLRHALEYFRDRHVDGVLVAGDMTDAGLETELRAFADA